MNSESQLRVRDLSGQVFGRLTAVRIGERQRGLRAWRCECECGVMTTVAQASLVNGQTRSCGCLRRDTSSRNGGHALARVDHAAIKRFLAGGKLNFVAIGKAVGCSRELVRQVAKGEGITGRGRSAIRVAKKIAARAERIRAVVERWKSEKVYAGPWEVKIINRHLRKRGKFRCGTCKQELPLSVRTKGDGVRCDRCNSANAKRYRDRLLRENPELVRARTQLSNAKQAAKARRLA